ncbi:MAG: hypothetical protein EBZ36_07200 [Acidobacteria bacterium]|jgi:hypothetical protein|nr:hypothetical protein [Acidobacteriota bacterium]
MLRTSPCVDSEHKSGLGGLDAIVNSLTYFNYVAQKKIVGFDPCYASAWDQELAVRLRGKGFTNPLYCKWLDLDRVQATFVGVLTGQADGADSVLIVQAVGR